MIEKNYFEFFELPIQFELNKSALKRGFLNNSKKYHPDFYTLASETAQNEALAMASFNNEAYKTLNDDDARMAYILKMYDLLGDQNQNETLPQDFLMEMMDINETLMELEFDFDKTAFEQVKNEINNLKSTIYASVKNDFEAFDQSEDETARKEILKKIKNFYLKSRYLLRIQKTLSTFASL